jgi:chemotaxis protein methyltransferase CheR
LSGWSKMLRELVERTTGIALLAGSPAEIVVMEYARRRADDLGYGSAASWILDLEKESWQGTEWQALLARLANGQTCFFRDSEQFQSMAAVMKGAARGRDLLHVWSSACATGEEAYSLAMLCRSKQLEAKVVATDIDRSFLERAEEGSYGSWALRHLDPALASSYLVRQDERCRVADEVRSMVTFEHHNLALESPIRSSASDGKWDLIVCRNVFLYFSRERTRAVCESLASALAPQGALVLSACESLHGLRLPLAPEQVGARVVYRHRPGAGEPCREPSVGVGEDVGSCAPACLDKRGLQEQAATTSRVSELLAIGHLFMREHELRLALGCYERAERQDSLLAEVHFFRGVALRKMGLWNEAGEALRQALFLAPAFWQASHMLAGVHERLGRFRTAGRERRNARRIIEERRGSVRFLSDARMVAWFCPSEDEALDALRKIRLLDDSPEAPSADKHRGPPGSLPASK